MLKKTQLLKENPRKEKKTAKVKNKVGGGSKNKPTPET